MDKEHNYRLAVVWTGNRGTGTSNYTDYSRDHEIHAEGKPALPGSSDPGFRGDASRYNPEELLVASLSACHMLWFLHLCAEAGIAVTSYRDDSEGAMREHADGSGEFIRVTLRPHATVTDAARIPEIGALHDRAHRLCFIARSVNFPVEHRPVTVQG
jgi:organic hydroperoxide reductase OsmC/OhrA